MFRFFTLVSVVLMLLCGVAQADRQEINWNSDWKFLDADAEPNAATQEWAGVTVPHTWDATSYRRGAGWYAKSFAAPSEWRNKRVFVFFEAVSIAADFNFDGGIYRPVHLLVCDRTLISPLDHASAGVYIQSRQISAENAQIEVKTLVSNGQANGATCRVETEIFDASGQSVARSRTSVAVEAGRSAPLVQVFSVARPHLWKALKDPYLYSVRVRLSGKGFSDEVRQPLGIRSVGFDADERFVLNGTIYPIRGINRHQDWKGKGWALSEADHATDAAVIKEMGATAIRLAHYPQSRVFLDLCDHNGLLLWEEVPVVNRILETDKFKDNAREQLTEMILQNFNHPSIMVWGLFNEVTRPAGTAPEKFVVQLRDVAHALDSSRATVGASDAPPLVDLNRAPDHIAFNIYPGWYFGLPSDYASAIKQRSRTLGGWRIALSEYGAGASVVQHEEGELSKLKTNSKFHPEEWQTYVHQSAWAQIKDNPHLWGTFVWSMFDFAVANRNEGDRPGINDKGLVTDDRVTRKDAFYFYKANWNTEPMVYIAARRMTPRNSATTQIKVFSNAGPVELFVNGQSLGVATADKVNVFRWEKVQLAAGKNHIEARTRGAGDSLSDACDWVLETP